MPRYGGTAAAARGNSGKGKQPHGGIAARGNSCSQKPRQQVSFPRENSGTGEQREQRHGGTTAARGNSGKGKTHLLPWLLRTAARGNSGTGKQRQGENSPVAVASENSGTGEQRHGGTAASVKFGMLSLERAREVLYEDRRQEVNARQ
ncbi:hypothetical protein ACOMHN_041177 [Nucella lapillus]